MKLKLNNQLLNKNVWNSIQTYKGILSVNKLTQEQVNEYESVKKLSEKLICDNFNRNPTFNQVRKTITGYSVSKCCYVKRKQNCFWTVNININLNEATILYDKECPHKNPKKLKSFY